MLIESFQYPGLGNSSHLVVDEATRTAVVVDPQRDVDQYLAAAARHGARITHALETHVHNDFVSGARELAAQQGTVVVAHAEARLLTEYTPVKAGDLLPFGHGSFRVLATPGHTPEHVSYLLEQPGAAPTLFSGGALMVGTIARTDLLGHEHALGLARQAWDTLHHTLFALPEETRVLPTHGAGSFCAGGASAERETSIGAEKRSNRFALLLEPEAFARAALEGLPRYPSYFARMRGLNQRGASLIGRLPELAAVPPEAVARRLREGAILVDTRPPADFDAEHVPGSLAVALEPAFSQWVGWLLPPDRPLLFVADASSARERIVRELARIAYDELEGHLAGGIDGWRKAGLPTTTTPRIDVGTLARMLTHDSHPRVLDVRWDDEWAEGHVPGAHHIPVPDLSARAAELGEGPVAVHCAHSFRSGIAVSLLEQAGIRDLYHLDGGIEAWQQAGLPVEVSKQRST